MSRKALTCGKLPIGRPHTEWSSCCCSPLPNPVAQQAQQLADLLRAYDLMSHVNLIPWNPVDESPYKRPGKAKVSAFKDILEKSGIPVSVRTTRGLEAAAACGQLRNQFQKAQLQDPKPLL